MVFAVTFASCEGYPLLPLVFWTKHSALGDYSVEWSCVRKGMSFEFVANTSISKNEKRKKESQQANTSI